MGGLSHNVQNVLLFCLLPTILLVISQVTNTTLIFDPEGGAPWFKLMSTLVPKVTDGMDAEQLVAWFFSEMRVLRDRMGLVPQSVDLFYSQMKKMREVMGLDEQDLSA
mmetsp:Transcript_18905/g.21709  ORF Transcript_18905/g.21709 Transcript_18905/m.21709 type:complete len:108 (-) Transcript_18905:23-346(-)